VLQSSNGFAAARRRRGGRAGARVVSPGEQAPPAGVALAALRKVQTKPAPDIAAQIERDLLARACRPVPEDDGFVLPDYDGRSWPTSPPRWPRCWACPSPGRRPCGPSIPPSG
jgi:hypothetical protein